MLNPEQQKAVSSAPYKPLLIVAGAGTGKTRALTHRLSYLIESGVPPEKICAITFTNKAAKEMKERAAKMLPSQTLAGKEPFIGTFHSLGARILRQEAHRAGRTRGYVIFDNHDSFSLIKKLYAQLFPTMVRPGSPQSASKKRGPAFFANAISAIKNSSENISLPGDEGRDRREIEELFGAYEASLAKQNAFDFDDLLQKPVFIFQHHPEILKKYQEFFSHILVDEYQDVNDLQEQFLRLLAGNKGQVSAVGDAEQTIYSFRGSNSDIFLNFPSRWRGPEMVTLTQNYRSTKTILRAASGVIGCNHYDTPVRRATDLWTENGEGEKLRLFEALDENDEAEWIAGQITKRKEEGASQIAVLYRTNAQSRAIEQALIAHEIPYRIYGGLKFYERKEIKDVVAAVRSAINPKDEIANERLEKELGKRRTAAWRAIFHAPGSPPVTIIAAFLTTMHYPEYLDRNFLNADERKENLEELIRFAGTFDDSALFLERVALLQATDEVVANETRDTRNRTIGDCLSLVNGQLSPVSLMTIHLAKGLEFDSVFLAGCAEGLLPHARSMTSEKETQEERRLMYVGMTRAKQKLSLSFYDLPSRFLSEIPEECVEFETTNGETGTLSPVDFEEKFISFD